ncbi:MAG: ABC transporter permease [Candidatus Thermoplasmatota archaeon]|nr:ABC transporter permease [Candidatus Thermoplasmatota archaeon]
MINFRFIAADLYSSIRQWLRSIGTVFWTLLFPVLLIIIFGAIFSGAGDVNYDIIVRDLDNSSFSEKFIQILENISVLRLDTGVKDDENISEYMREKDITAALVIPKGFESQLQQAFTNPNITVDIQFYFDPSDQSTTPIIRNIVASTLNEFNMNVTNGRRIIVMNEISTLGEEYDFIDFFVPGIIGFTIMTSCIYGSIERNTKYRKDGILRKLLTMPISRADWILSKMLFMLFLSFISASVILLVGVMAWGLNIEINIFFFVIIVATSFLFSGMGMIISRFVKDEETADMAGGAITFPMMFLAGTFFPLDQMPSFLQTFAQILPLYYVNEALRNAMIYSNVEKSLNFSAFVLIFAAIFFILGIVVTKWKEE